MNKTRPFLHTGRTIPLISLVFYILLEKNPFALGVSFPTKKRNNRRRRMRYRKELNDMSPTCLYPSPPHNPLLNDRDDIPLLLEDKK